MAEHWIALKPDFETRTAFIFSITQKKVFFKVGSFRYIGEGFLSHLLARSVQVYDAR